MRIANCVYMYSCNASSILSLFFFKLYNYCKYIRKNMYSRASERALWRITPTVFMHCKPTHTHTGDQFLLHLHTFRNDPSMYHHHHIYKRLFFYAHHTLTRTRYNKFCAVYILFAGARALSRNPRSFITEKNPLASKLEQYTTVRAMRVFGGGGGGGALMLWETGNNFNVLLTNYILRLL